MVCGSATDISRLQVERLAAAVPYVDVLTAPPATGDLVPHVVVELAGRAQRSDGGPTSTRPLSSSVATLPPRCWAMCPAWWVAPCGRVCRGATTPQGQGPLVITKAGGFGSPDALVDLFEGETG